MMRKNFARASVSVAAALAVSASFPHVASAAVWNGGNSNWFTASNWTPANVPDAPGETADTNTTTNDTITYNSTGSNTIDSLTVRGGDILTFRTSPSARANLTVSALSIETGATVRVDNSNQNSGRERTLTYNGSNFTNLGAVTVVSASGNGRDARFNLNGDNNANAGTITLSGGNGSGNGESTLNINSLTVNGVTTPATLFTNSGTITVLGTGTSSNAIKTNGAEYRQTAGLTLLGTDAGSTTLLFAGAGVVNINGGTLAGTGQVSSTGGININSGGLIAPGDASTVGTMSNTGNTLINGIFDVDLDGTTSDLLAIVGAANTLTLNGEVNVQNITAPTANEYLIATASAITLGSGASVTGDGDYALQLRNGNSELYLVASAVPEPTSLSLLGLAGLGLLRRRRGQSLR